MVDTILTPGPDNFIGTSAADSIDGIGGNDTIQGESANDTLIGGADNDWLYGGAQNDSVNGGTGDDYLFGDSGNDIVIGGEGNDSLTGGDEDDSMFGGAGNDTFFDLGGNNYYSLGSGNDSVMGENAGIMFVDGSGGGDDVIRVNANWANYWTTISGGADSVDDQGRSYNSVVIGNGYTIRMRDFHGDVIFNNGVMPVVCFREGTNIMTAEGERAIETLRAGDLVVTASGRGAALKPVLWVGRREVNLDAHPRGETVAPVLVMPGALGAGVPHRPLCVSPDHALLVDGALVPAKFLLDGEAIRQLPARGTVTYLHVELAAHDILFSEGAPSESYMDRGNRSAFGNAGAVQMLHADFTPAHLDGGLPIVTEGPALEKARLFLATLRGATAEALRRSA